MSYTIKNLRDIEDSAPGHGLSETQEARFANADLALEDTGLSHHVVKPGRRHAFGHRHEAAEEVYVVLSGRGRIKVEDELVDVGPLDAVRVSARAARGFEAGDEGLELLAFGPRHEGDGEIVPGGEFWGD